eukprot:172751-Pelagomonas_calceolata.AAC.1
MRILSLPSGSGGCLQDHFIIAFRITSSLPSGSFHHCLQDQEDAFRITSSLPSGSGGCLQFTTQLLHLAACQGLGHVFILKERASRCGDGRMGDLLPKGNTFVD